MINKDLIIIVRGMTLGI